MDKKIIDFMNEVKATRSSYHKVTTPLQDLHEKFGFDFNKPIICEKKKGSFTPCALAKEFGFDFKTDVVVVILKERNYYNIVRLYSDRVDIDCYGTSWFCTYYSKKEYNERRQGYGETYVIAQNKSLVSEVKTGYRREVISIDTRYTLCINAYGMEIKGVKNSRVSDVELDKSGYPVEEKRNLLNRNRKNLIAKRNAEKYKAMTNTQDMIDKAKKAIEAKKVELSKKVLAITDLASADKVKSDMYYLRECYYEIETIELRDAKKTFESPKEFNNSISYIYTKLARI